MNVWVIFWGAIGVATGATHAGALWRSSQASKAPRWGVAWLAWRLPAVAAVLVFAALGHGLLPAVIGWLVGLTTMSALYLARTRRWM
jgi:hypothetical protein